MTRKYLLPLVFVLLLLSGCQKKPVHLPVIGIPGIPEIQNHSSIWIFMEIRQGDTLAIMNKNNKILNTHWIFNIDRNLPMKSIIPHLQEMQENRNKDSMHKKEGMKNYFSYADTLSKKIALTSFPLISYISVDREDLLKNRVASDSCALQVELAGNRVRIKDQLLPLDSLPDKLGTSGACLHKKEPKVILTYSEQIRYQDYLNMKVYLADRQISCDSVEYVYTVK